ncbi:MAG TPA: ComF family protein [Haloplasmataceae bacterium]
MVCLLCGDYIRPKLNFSSLFLYPKTICDKCQNRLETVKRGCPICGKKNLDDICEDCRYWEKNHIVVPNYSLYYYNSYAKEIMRRIKFLGDAHLLLAFQNDIKEFFKKGKYKNYYLVPVPLHPIRFIERGFNQSLLLANLINLPIIDIVVRTSNEKQSKKKKVDRLVLDNQYQLIDRIENDVKNIIIVDDIYTTGATVHKIAKLLYDNNIEKVVSFTLFRS